MTSKKRPMKYHLSFNEAVRLYEEEVPEPRPFQVDRRAHKIGSLQAHYVRERYVVPTVGLNRIIRRAKEYQERSKMTLEERLAMITFSNELRTLLRKYSKHKVSDTPDVVLATYIERCLSAYESAVAERLFWLNEQTQPGEEIKTDEISPDL